jgi:hypothetical protein
MVKKTYVPNGIRIPNYRGDLGPKELCMEERWQESPIEPPQRKREGEMKKEIRKKEKNDR